MTNRPSSAVAVSDYPPTSPARQTLWHVRRGGKFPIIAQLRSGERWTVQVTYGMVASRQRTFEGPTAALLWSEKLLAQLEEAGFSRHRIDRRRDDLPAAPAR